MIRVMTLDTGEHLNRSTHRLPECIVPLRPAALDILCCQSIRRATDGNRDLTHALSHSLGLTSSCFAANRRQSKAKGRRTKDVSGLAILTGIGVWMLNSGSFPVPVDEEGEEGIVQFALVRKNGASVLVLNLELATSVDSQRVQLHTLFSHPLLKELYGAVVLCGDRQTTLSAKELQALTTRSNYCLHRGLLPAFPGKGMLCLLASREEQAVAVTFGNTGPLRAGDAPDPALLPPSGLTLEFEVDRIPQTKKTRPYLPLSFREQWLGNKEKYPAFAA